MTHEQKQFEDAQTAAEEANIPMHEWRLNQIKEIAEGMDEIMRPQDYSEYAREPF